MSDFESFECEQCGDTFTAHPGAPAAERNYCTPSCEVSEAGSD